MVDLIAITDGALLGSEILAGFMAPQRMLKIYAWASFLIGATAYALRMMHMQNAWLNHAWVLLNIFMLLPAVHGKSKVPLGLLIGALVMLWAFVVHEFGFTAYNGLPQSATAAVIVLLACGRCNALAVAAVADCSIWAIAEGMSCKMAPWPWAFRNILWVWAFLQMKRPLS